MKEGPLKNPCDFIKIFIVKSFKSMMSTVDVKIQQLLMKLNNGDVSWLKVSQGHQIFN